MYWCIEARCNHSAMPAILARVQGTQAQYASKLHFSFYLSILQTFQTGVKKCRSPNPLPIQTVKMKVVFIKHSIVHKGEKNKPTQKKKFMKVNAHTYITLRKQKQHLQMNTNLLWI